VLDDLPFFELAAPETSHNSFATQTVAHHASQILPLFCERHARRLKALDHDLFSLISSIDSSLKFETAWDPAFGGIHAATCGVTDGVEERATALALRLHECGYQGSWSAPLSSAVRLHFDRWPLPIGERIRVRVDGSRARISILSSAGEEHLCFSREDEGWRAEHASPFLHEARLETLRLVIWRRHELWSDEVADIAHNVDDSEPYLMARRCEAALGLLKERSPRYFAWVARVVRFVAPWLVRSSARPTGSGSTNFAPGLIGIGNHDDEFPLADTLVHEASHHYFFIMLRFGGVHDGSDTRLYFNPFLEIDRPLDRILFSYHAFANVLLFCRELATSGSTGREYLERHIAHLEKGLGVLDQELASTTSLTTAGHTIWQHLRGKIQLANEDSLREEAQK
jgi:hypothetical protein